MGGNALQYVKTERKSAISYTSIMTDVLNQIENLFPLTRCALVRSYTEKESFGDGDILLDSSLLPADWMRIVQIEFNPGEFVINRIGGTPLTYTHPNIPQSNPDLVNQNIVPDVSPDCMTVSFDYQNFQIDIITVKAEEFNCAKNYYAYNDLGNLIGRVADKAGFKFGWNGLTKTLMDKSHKIDTIRISCDYFEMLELFGYSKQRFGQGFKTLEEIFEYVASSPYFHRSLFTLENRSHKDRTRDAKRSTYTNFLAWMADKPELDKYEWYTATPNEPSEARDDEHSRWMDRAYLAYPWLSDKLRNRIQLYKTTTMAKERFNGDVVARETLYTGVKLGYTGVKLGRFLQYCKGRYPYHGTALSWEEWVIKLGPNQLLGFIKDKSIEFDALWSTGELAVGDSCTETD